MDTAGDLLHKTALHVARQADEASSTGRPASYKPIGLSLAVASGLFIGVSFVIKKIGLLKANKKYNEEAGEGYGYLKNLWWWAGMILMIVGEVCNFAAYMFVDAILVTPLGALSVVVTTILSWWLLKERLSFVGWVSCFLCILGSVVIALNAPEQSAVSNIQEMKDHVIAPGFLAFTGVIILVCVGIAWYAAPRWGKKSMMVYITICSLIGGLSVVATQGLGSAITAAFRGEPNQWNQWFTYVLLVFVACTLVTEIIYLNKALNIFNAALVTPTYYVFFTSSTIITSAVLFKGLGGDGQAIPIVNVLMGFLTICSGVVLLQLAKSSKDVPDSKVFSGDLDQIRTVAEVQEPEYEPRADAVRGSAGIMRAFSGARHKRELDEAHRIHDEVHMETIGEGEQYEWDGLRRRKTVSSAGGSIVRRKTLHPPLGMSQFPPDDDNVSEPDSEVHPGFFGRIGRGFTQRRNRGHSPVPLETVTVGKVDEDEAIRQGAHAYGLAPGPQKGLDQVHVDTSYRSPAGTSLDGGVGRIQWAGEERPSSATGSLAPPRPPPHATGGASGARRQFSFQNVFSRNRSESTTDDAHRPISRGALSFASRGGSSRGGNYPAGPATTEEERLGLVHGDSSNAVTSPARGTGINEEEERSSDSEEWARVSQHRHSSSSPEIVSSSGDLGRRTRDPYADDHDDELYDAPPRLRSSSPGDDDARGASRGGAFV